MDDAIALGIDAKHSNEDAIAPYDEWITRYGDQIGLLGGIDVDLLCQNNPQDVYSIVLDRGLKFRAKANGYALGSGNSIPDYVPVDGYLAMIAAVKRSADFDDPPAEKMASNYTWPRVFQRTLAVYHDALRQQA